MKYVFSIILLGLLHPQAAVSRTDDDLTRCWEQQVKPTGNGYIHFIYQETRRQLAHLSEPWETYHTADTGYIWCNGNQLMKIDSVCQRGGKYYSKTQFSISDSVLLYLGYGDKEIARTTAAMIADEPVDEARFTPVMLLSYIYRHATEANMESSKQYAIYSLNINKAIVSLYIRKKDDLLEKVTAKSNDDLYGDVTTAISYSGYTAMDHICYPSVIYIDKINGKVKDTIAITSATFTKEMKPVLEKPAGYKLAEEKITKPEISVEKYNDHIHFITLKHTNGRAMVVEYNDYLLVAEAPLNSGNGELIIAEARKIAPGKPIKYFVFCHYHPDYIGGIRAFIHKGATVLCTKGDMQYVEYLANASHTMNPDSLELQPQQLQTEDIGGHKTISDGKYQMEIYFIGSKSEHTKDYLVYYFPQEKMLFEGDLAWIPEKGPAKKAGKRQAGLYHAIKDLNLDVAMIEQSWPASGYGIKTEIPFTEMEEAMNMR